MSQQQTRPRRVDARRVGALLFATLVIGALAPLPAAGATQTICVALVVDFTPLNGNVDSGCTRVPQGATGYDVLHAGGHTFEVCSNGVIGTIDGQPANGCQVKDNTHFWGYWHRRPDSRTWTFSSYGAAIYHPGEGSTEGWVWENGTTSPPADVPYPADCHSPPSSPTPAPSTSSMRSTGGTNSSPPPEAQDQGDAAGASTPGSSTTRPTTRHPGGRRPRPTTTTKSATPTALPMLVTPTATSTARVLTGAPSDGGSNGGPVAPVAAGLGVAALLGAGAWWRSRRSDSVS